FGQPPGVLRRSHPARPRRVSDHPAAPAALAASEYLEQVAELLFDQFLDVIRVHEPEIEPLLRGAALDPAASPELLARTIQAQGMWFQLLSIAEQNAAMRQRRQAELERAWGLHFVTENLFDVVPELVDKLDRAVRQAYPGAPFELAPFFQLGSWIGGDRDGNPFVTNEVTHQTVCDNRVASLRRYRQRLAELLQALSPTERAAPIS